MGVKRTQNASFHSNQSIHFLHQKDTYDDGTYDDGTYDDGTYDDGSEGNLYAMQGLSYSSQPPSYDKVRGLESLWQPDYMERYDNELETIHELPHLAHSE